MLQTKIIKIDSTKPDPAAIRQAADILRQGGLVIVPTETVYGVAANALDKKAIAALEKLKQRPHNKPFSLLIGDKLQIEKYAIDIPLAAYKLIDKFWPGPLTVILKSKENSTVGLRMPDNRVTLEIVEEAGLPLACPSANLAGEPAPSSFEEALKGLDGLVDLAIDAGNTSIGVESTVVDLAVTPPKVLREAAIKASVIIEEAGKKTILFVCTGNSCRSVMAEALLKKKLKQANRGNVDVLSAGISMFSGMNATESTRQVLAQEGIDVSTHRSQAVNAIMIKKSDLILVMEDMHEEKILQIVPDAKNRVFLLKEFAKIDDGDLNITDPIGGSGEFYQQTFSVIKQAVERIIEVI